MNKIICCGQAAAAAVDLVLSPDPEPGGFCATYTKPSADCRTRRRSLENGKLTET